jgi:hypothetical protein
LAASSAARLPGFVCATQAAALPAMLAALVFSYQIAHQKSEALDAPGGGFLHEQVAGCDADGEFDLRLINPDRQVLEFGGELVGARPLTKIDLDVADGHLPSPAARSAFFHVPNRRINVQ